jgi:hypothetical protein
MGSVRVLAFIKFLKQQSGKGITRRQRLFRRDPEIHASRVGYPCSSTKCIDNGYGGV